jgi:GNAT superfamily N-acetyltransferase
MFRPATREDLSALTDLERAANLAALGHVFPADRYPFPDDDVLARWALVLEEPGVTVHVLDGERGLDAVAAFDHTTLRHLAVHPSRWGQGLATTLVGLSLDAMAAGGATEAQLWCLEDNGRARRLYERLGWSPAEDRREAVWPPHPTEMRYTRPIAPAR